MRLFLAGDIMTGRGVDQIMAHPVDPAIHEDHVRSATGYVALAEAVSGPIPRKVAGDYVWGTALAALRRRRPDLAIVNLETAVTARGTPAPKGINYRMHPANAGVLAAAGIDCCVLANNHVLDWGTAGLLDTLDTLAARDIAFVGAGRSAAEAACPFEGAAGGGRRLRLLAYGLPSAGVPAAWAADRDRPGVSVLAGPDAAAIARVRREVAAGRRPGDVAAVSLHWGPNWGEAVPAAHRRFAHALIEEAGVDLVYGHSSHHPLAAEVHRGRAVLYGCGDLLNDYEGISGYAAFRPDLVIGWFVDLAGDGRLASLEMVPLQLARFRLTSPDAADRAWLRAAMDRRCAVFGRRVGATAEGALRLLEPGETP